MWLFTIRQKEQTGQFMYVPCACGDPPGYEEGKTMIGLTFSPDLVGSQFPHSVLLQCHSHTDC